MRTTPYALARLTATAVAFPAAAAAAPPLHGDRFEVDDGLEQEVRARIASLCDVDIAAVDGSGTIRFTQFVNSEGDIVRGQGYFHLTFVVTTLDGHQVTLRERSLDRYQFVDGDIVLTTTSGRAVAFLDSIGRLVTGPDGEVVSDAGRDNDVCAALR